MQISSTPGDERRAIRPGDVVRVRRARWRILHVRPYDACQVVTLRGLAPPHLERRIVVPFETIEPIERAARPRFVRGITWRRALREVVAADVPPGSLRAAASAGTDIFPHQLAPAMAIVRGLGPRVLLADEVGLGKTIQAGLVASE